MFVHVFVPNVEVHLVEDFLVALLKRKSWLCFEGIGWLERLVVEFDGVSSGRGLYFFEDIVDFELSPYKVGVVYFVCEVPPISSFDYTFDKIGIVTKSNKCSICCLLI